MLYGSSVFFNPCILCTSSRWTLAEDATTLAPASRIIIRMEAFFQVLDIAAGLHTGDSGDMGLQIQIVSTTTWHSGHKTQDTLEENHSGGHAVPRSMEKGDTA